MALTRKSLHRTVLDKICEEMSYATSTNPKGILPHGTMTRILKQYKKEHPWLNRDKINFHYGKFKKDPSRSAVTVPVIDTGSESNTTTAGPENETASRFKGRPKGTTKASKFLMKQTMTAAKNEIAQMYFEAKAKASSEGEKLEDGWLQKVVDDVKEKRGIGKDVAISLKTIRNRVKSVVLHPGKQSLMAPIEPKLVELVLAMAKIRRCLTVSETLGLANDLIRNTDLEKKIIQWKKKTLHLDVKKKDPVLGRKYWTLFKKRWEHKLVSKRGQKFAMDRNNALTYPNVRQMYEDVYESMVEAGVAKKLTEPDMNQPGTFKCHYELTHPEMCLVVDEVGANLNQKDDGHIGGQKFMCEVGAVPQLKVSTKDKHFTLLGFTSLKGEAVMCLLILAGVEQKFEVETGIDMTAPTYGDVKDKDFFERNCGKGKMFPMGPDCRVNGIRVPCMVRWSPKGSITSDILRDAVKTLDHYKIFDRSDNKRPFLLLDGHGSRFNLPFMEYIVNESHPWVVCIGVPYGTSMWQVADSKEQNGSYKMALYRAKKELLEQKMSYMIDPLTLVPTDIVPIVNIAWRGSFVNKENNKVAISDCGWNPLNYALLHNDDIKSSMTSNDLIHYKSILKVDNQTDEFANSAIADGSAGTRTISEITSPSLNYDARFLSTAPIDEVSFSSKLNFKSGHSQVVLESLVHHHDLSLARENIKANKEKGDAMKQKTADIKNLTAMYNFKNIGCRIGKDSLQLKQQMTKDKMERERKKKMEKEKKVAEKKMKNDINTFKRIEKEKNKFELRKRKYDEIMSLNLPLDKLSNRQLNDLINFKKLKEDTFLNSKMKKVELIPLWNQLKDRPIPTFENEIDSTYMQTVRPPPEQQTTEEAETGSHAGSVDCQPTSV